MNRFFMYGLKIIFFILIIPMQNIEWVSKSSYVLASDKNYEGRIRLSKLISYETDNIILIELCLNNVKTASIRYKLMKMIDECKNNRHNLEGLLNSYGLDILIKPPMDESDAKGLLMEGYAVLKAGLTEKGALKILHDHMKTFIHAYEEALKEIQSNEEKVTIQSILEGKRKFLHYLEFSLSQCVVKENLNDK